MPSGNWSFPCSPRNPAKVREELRLLETLVPTWRERQLPWTPRSGAQLEFGRRLRLAAAEPQGADEGDNLRFQRQSEALTDDNLRWTARARWGTYRFFGFVTLDPNGYATLTPAGAALIHAPRPGEVLLKQLLKWQYPDYQHGGSRWPAADFAIHPFIATARLIRELEGLSRQELALFCFTMRRTEDAAATAEAIRQFRARQSRASGRAGKARAARGAQDAARARYEAEGRRVVLSSMHDYADALVRYFRYTGLFSVRGSRIVVASGREAELDELVFDGATEASPSARASSFTAPGLQLALGEAPPVRLAAPRPLYPHYEDPAAFYGFFGDGAAPRLPWEDPQRLASLALALRQQVEVLRAREAQLRSGRVVLDGTAASTPLPQTYDALASLVDGLRQRKRRLDEAIYAAESRSPERLRQALDYFGPVLRREVIDPPTFLEWNTWRTFLALGQAREVLPNLALDDDLQPLAPAQGGQPDLEVDYSQFRLVVEVTLRSGADQRQAEARPVTRHILDVMRRRAPQPVYGLFLAPKLHADTATDFFVALKYRVIERQQIAAIPLTVHQFMSTLRPFAGATAFSPAALRTLLDRCVAAGMEADTGDEWLAGIDAALRRWLSAVGGSLSMPQRAPQPLPLPLLM